MRGRWRNYRNNTTIRSDIGRILRYKCHLLGIRFHSERPRGTSHTCPHCGKPACAHCGYNADRDYRAALNIARLGIAFLTFIQTTGQGKAFSVTAIEAVKPCPYMAHGAVLLFPPQTDLHRLLEGGKLYINGWKQSVTLRSSYATPLLLRLCS